jgi:hypothetical protein
MFIVFLCVLRSIQKVFGVPFESPSVSLLFLNADNFRVEIGVFCVCFAVLIQHTQLLESTEKEKL